MVMNLQVQKRGFCSTVKKNESVYPCLSRRIDHFNLVLNNKTCISTIVNSAQEKDCELNSSQTILIFQ